MINNFYFKSCQTVAAFKLVDGSSRSGMLGTWSTDFLNRELQVEVEILPLKIISSEMGKRFLLNGRRQLASILSLDLTSDKWASFGVVT